VAGHTFVTAPNKFEALAAHDALVFAHGALKTLAAAMMKIANDVRWLSSGPRCGIGELSIPENEPGSSIMPGKVNPVIAEYVISAAHSVYGHDIVITSLCGQGFLDLNAYLPSIGHYMLESLDLLISANKTLSAHLIDGLTIDGSASFASVIRRPTTATALLPYIGYHNAEKLAGRMQEMDEDLFQAAAQLNILDKTRLLELLSPSRLLELGYRLSDISKAK
jgi:fumarate hydratase class II